MYIYILYQVLKTEKSFNYFMIELETFFVNQAYLALNKLELRFASYVLDRLEVRINGVLK
jgi:hypothetical protein